MRRCLRRERPFRRAAVPPAWPAARPKLPPAAAAKVTTSTLNRMEATGDDPPGLAVNLQKVMDALHVAGTEFIPNGGVQDSEVGSGDADLHR